jgi:hypothetical protein
VTFISNAQRLQKSLDKAGGADKASRAIEDYVKNFKGHQLSKPLRSNSSFNERSLTGSFREKCEFAFGSGSDFESMLPSFEG